MQGDRSHDTTLISRVKRAANNVNNDVAKINKFVDNISKLFFAEWQSHFESVFGQECQTSPMSPGSIVIRISASDSDDTSSSVTKCHVYSLAIT